MSEANIYLSITSGKSVLTIDGDFCLFRDFLASLKNDLPALLLVESADRQPVNTPIPQPAEMVAA